MTTRAEPSPRRRLKAVMLLGCCVLPANLASAQIAPSPMGFASLPTFAWPQPASVDDGRWAGSYATVSTGFAVSSSRYFGSYAGPTLGVEAGRLWQEGRFVYGISGGFDYLGGLGGGLTNGFGSFAYSRDFAGAVQVKAGVLLSPDVLVYGKLGAFAVHENLRLAPTAVAQPFSRDDLAVLPDARAGVEWAITDRLSVAVEAGMTGPRLR